MSEQHNRVSKWKTGDCVHTLMLELADDRVAEIDVYGDKACVTLFDDAGEWVSSAMSIPVQDALRLIDLWCLTMTGYHAPKLEA